MQRQLEEKYWPLTQEQESRLEKDFTYHPPHGDQVERYTFLRDCFKGCAATILANTPSSREQSLALTHLEEAMLWANASIARNEK